MRHRSCLPPQYADAVRTRPFKNIVPGTWRRVALCAVALAGLVRAQSVAALPGAQANGNSVPVFADSALKKISTGDGVPAGAFQLLPKPDGSKSYVLSASPGITLLDRNFGNPAQILPSLANPSRAALSPDGRLLVAISDNSAYLVDTATDQVVAGPLPVSGKFIDMAFSHDSRAAYLLSSQESIANVTPIDLNTRAAGTILSFPASGPSDLAMAPSGLLYVSAPNGLFEVEPVAMRLNAGLDPSSTATIPVRAAPEALSFTSDCRYAVALSRTPLTVGAVLFDLTAKTASVISSVSLDSPLDQLLLVSDNRVVARSQGGKIYEAVLGGTFRQSALSSGLPPGAKVLSMLPSGEVSARYLYVTAAEDGASMLYRVDLASSAVASKGQLPPQAGNLLAAVTTPAAQGPMTVQGVNAAQTAGAGSLSRPFVARVVDASGFPVYRAKVSFTPLCGGLSIGDATAETNSRGFAIAFATAGDASGSYLVQAAVPGGLGGGFTYTVAIGGGTSPGGGCKPLVDTPRLSIVRGDGQLVPEQAMALQPLMVSVKDADGNPIPYHPIRFSIVNGLGTIACLGVGAPFSYVPKGQCMAYGVDGVMTVTDSTGQAAVTFLSTAVAPLSFDQAVIRASSLFANIDFTITTVLLARSNGNLASLPVADIFAPAASPTPGTTGIRLVKGVSGRVVRRAIQIQVVPADGPQAGQPIPRVALNVIAPDDPYASPSGVCLGGPVLTDAMGVATCDLVLGPVTGTGLLKVNIGDAIETPLMGVSVAPGSPLTVRILEGDNQSARPGQSLTLRGQVTDENGLPAPGIPIIWQLSQGGAALHIASQKSDAQGYVEAKLTLGFAPGPVTARFTAAPGSSAAASGTFTVTGIY